jgi:hypothetical protein
MLVHQLVVIPTEETIEYLSNVFDGCSWDLDLRSVYVEINTSAETMKADTDRLYTAYAQTLDRFYDTATGETSLLLPLVCEGLVERARELRQKAPSAFYGDYYFPYLVVKRAMPTLKRHRRGLLQSYSEQLYSHQQPLFFDAEIVIPKDYDTIPDLDFYTTQVQSQQ